MSLSSPHPPRSRPLRRKILIQTAAVVVVVPFCLWAGQPFLATLDWHLVRSAWQGISAVQWIMALLFSALSFLAVGRYDVIIHRHLGTGISDRQAHLSGAAAVALAQVLGLGLVSGTLARWRALPELSARQATCVTLLVTCSFLVAWLGIFAVSGLLLPTALPLPPLVFTGCLISAFCIVLYSVLRRHVPVLGNRIRLPSLRASAALLVYAGLDTALAATAFWSLLPQGADIALPHVFAIYLACLGASLVSTTPGGVGPFEVTLLWALNTQDVNGVMATLLGFRLVYFALPACLAMLYLAKPNVTKSPTVKRTTETSHLHPESGVARQGGALLYSNEGHPIAALGQSTQAQVCLFEPCVPFEQSLPELQAAARARATGWMYYKCSARYAAQARMAGFATARITCDCILDLSCEPDLNTPARRSLRRKLRRADAARVRIAPLTAPHFAQARDVDAQWQVCHGRARGVSMGRFTPAYLADQTCFGAWIDDDLFAFISCHTARDGWALDLMRSRPNVPDGVMHALLWHAIKAAFAADAPQFSLASIPGADAPMLRSLHKLLPRRAAGADGLARFKGSFAPRQVPLYAVAASRAELCLILWDLWKEIHDPPAV